MVDGHGRVYGLDGLVVADASIMPTIPRANTNLSTIALAERIADTLVRVFAQALATKDSEALRAVLHPDVDFRGLTPNRFWEAHDRDAVLDIVFGVWFGSHTSWRSSCSWNPTLSPTANRSASAFAGATVTGP